MAGDLSYFYIPVADHKRAGVFFSALLGWDLTERPGGDDVAAERQHGVLLRASERN